MPEPAYHGMVSEAVFTLEHGQLFLLRWQNPQITAFITGFYHL